MKEKLLPATLAAGIAVGGFVGGSEAEAPCVDDEARSMALAAYRTAVDADMASTIIYIALTGAEGRPYTYEEYRELFDLMTNDILDGKDPMTPGFRQDAGRVPEPTPIVDFTEGGENE
jgi:hypothetical protein